MRFLSCYVVLLTVLVSWLVFGCQTTKTPLVHCDDYLKARIASLKAEGYEIVEGKDVFAREGVIMVGHFLNVDKSKVHSEALTDTTAVATLLIKVGFKQELSCQRGDKEWKILTKREKVQTQTH